MTVGIIVGVYIWMHCVYWLCSVTIPIKYRNESIKVVRKQVCVETHSDDQTVVVFINVYSISENGSLTFGLSL